VTSISSFYCVLGTYIDAKILSGREHIGWNILDIVGLDPPNHVRRRLVALVLMIGCGSANEVQPKQGDVVALIRGLEQQILF
jgi:hypothetical protein